MANLIDGFHRIVCLCLHKHILPIVPDFFESSPPISPVSYWIFPVKMISVTELAIYGELTSNP